MKAALVVSNISTATTSATIIPPLSLTILKTVTPSETSGALEEYLFSYFARRVVSLWGNSALLLSVWWPPSLSAILPNYSEPGASTNTTKKHTKTKSNQISQCTVGNIFIFNLISPHRNIFLQIFHLSESSKTTSIWSDLLSQVVQNHNTADYKSCCGI